LSLGTLTNPWDGSSSCRPDLQTQQGRSLGCAEMGDLFVAERFRGRSVGGTLMEAAEDWARDQGESNLVLAVTVANPHNDVARSMYERAGYEESGLGVFEDGCFYWDEAGECQWDGEPHRYLVKDLDKG
jgi:GNAT superfamily N-acetyltransferase